MSDDPALLHEFVYVSRIAASMSPDSIADIVIEARHKNHRLGITGCLIFAGAHLAQLLEGPADVVLPLVEVIAHDARHHNFRILRSRQIATRRFPSWSMRLLLRENVEKLLLAIEGDASMEPRRVDEVVGLLFAGTKNAP